MKNSQKIYKLENSQEVSKSKFFRLKNKAKKLGCLLDGVEYKEIAKLLKNANIQDLDIALKKLRAAINPKLNTFILNQ